MNPVYIILVIVALTFLGWKYIEYLKATRGTKGFAMRKMAYYLFIAFMSFIGITNVFADALFEFLKLEKPQHFEIISLIAFVFLCVAFVLIARFSSKTQVIYQEEPKPKETPPLITNIHSGSGDNIAGDKTIKEDKSKAVQATTYIEKQIITQAPPQQEVPQPSGTKTPKILTQLPELAEKLIGRKTDITTLVQTIQDGNRVVLMNGMGGIGKTTLATYYANAYKSQYDYIVWIEQLGDFASDIATNTILTNNLGVPLSGDIQQDAKLILNTLTNLSGKGLFVIDNADAQLTPYASYLPKAPNWRVLLTSREELPFAEEVPLGFMPEEDAIAMFYTYYTRDKDDALVKKILQDIGYHTLTLEILAKTAQNLEINSLSKLVSLLEERGIKLRKPVDFTTVTHHKDKDQNTRLFPYLKAIFQLDALSEDEIFLLKQFIALPPKFIDWDFLMELLDIEEEERRDLLITTRNTLKKKGWLLYDTTQDAYKMHRIIQDVLQEKLQPSYKEIKSVITQVSTLLRIDQTKDNPVEKFQYIVYGKHIVKLLPDEAHPDFTRLQNNLATVLKDLGDYTGAKELLEKALASDEKNFGVSHPNTAVSYSNLAMVLQDLGDYTGAKSLLEKALVSDEKNFGVSHPTTAVRYSNLALVLQDLGDYTGAKGLLEKAVASDEKNFGVSHPNTCLLYTSPSPRDLSTSRIPSSA